MREQSQLKFLRLIQGLYQRDVAARIGVSQRFVSFLEHGQRRPSQKIIKRLEELFGVEREALFPTGEDKKEIKDDGKTD